MTARESAIISAHTGILCGPFSSMHKYIEEIIGRPVLTHELAVRAMWEEIKTRSKEDFMALTSGIKEE